MRSAYRIKYNFSEGSSKGFSGPTSGAISLRKPLGPFTKRRRNAARSQECVSTGHGNADCAGKLLGLATLLCGIPVSYLRAFVLLGQEMFYGTAHF